MTLLLFIHIICFQLEVTPILHFSVDFLCAHPTLLLLPDCIFMYSIYGIEEKRRQSRNISIMLFGIGYSGGLAEFSRFG